MTTVIPEIAIKRPHLYATASRVAVGTIGELWARNQIQDIDLKCVNGDRYYGDLKAVHPGTGEIANIEVKTARRGKDGKWRFTLRKRGHTDHRQTDFLILIALTVSATIAFIIPTAKLVAKNHAVITSHPKQYTGRLAEYRNAWDLLTSHFSQPIN